MKAEVLAKQLDVTRDIVLSSFEVRTEKVEYYPDIDRFVKELYPDWTSGSVYYGTWSRKRLLYHMTLYEEIIAYPTMGLLHGEEPDGDFVNDTINNEQTSYDEGVDLDNLISRFNAIRDKQIEILNGVSDEELDRTRKTFWGDKPLSWVLAKTLQHSFEHGNKMMRHAYFGDVDNLKQQLMEKVENDKKEGIDYPEEFLSELQNAEYVKC